MDKKKLFTAVGVQLLKNMKVKYAINIKCVT